MAADGAPDLGAPAASMDSLPEGEQLQLGIKPSYYRPQENGGESAEDTGHSRRRYGDGQSIHGDTVRGCAALSRAVFPPATAMADAHGCAPSRPLCLPRWRKIVQPVVTTTLGCSHDCYARRPRGGAPSPSSCSSHPWATCGVASGLFGYGTCRWQTPPAAIMTSARRCEPWSFAVCLLLPRCRCAGAWLVCSCWAGVFLLLVLLLVHWPADCELLMRR